MRLPFVSQEFGLERNHCTGSRNELSIYLSSLLIVRAANLKFKPRFKYFRRSLFNYTYLVCPSFFKSSGSRTMENLKNSRNNSACFKNSLVRSVSSANAPANKNYEQVFILKVRSCSLFASVKTQQESGKQDLR